MSTFRAVRAVANIRAPYASTMRVLSRTYHDTVMDGLAEEFREQIRSAGATVSVASTAKEDGGSSN